jgi:nanoRNase/pAp phosphatase (c-di-AMP/oligoRNAs hydrolase)
MPETIDQQVIDTISKSRTILLVLPQNPNGDAIGAGLALCEFLKKLDKQPEIVSAAQDFGQFSFLPGINQIKKGLDATQTFVISVNTSSTPLDELSYQEEAAKVDIFLKPKN